MMKKSTLVIVGLILLIAAGYLATGSSGLFTSPEPITVINPYDQTVYPPDIAPPTFEWDDRFSGAHYWEITIDFPDGSSPLATFTSVTDWAPSSEQWENIKSRTVEQQATVTIAGLKNRNPGLLALNNTLSRQTFAFSTSADSVGVPIFYRDVPLPFDFAREKMELIQWRLGDISKSETPPVILSGLPVCANCHSFSRDGSKMAMDLDSGGDKGAFVVTDVDKQMYLNREDTISWTDFRREDNQPTFGLLAQISPNGRYVAAAVKDRVIFLTRQNIMFSQLFFPVKGIIAIYDRQTGETTALPGADDPDYVQANPVWTPDGKHVLFTRHPVSEYVKTHDVDNAILSVTESAIVLGGSEYLENSEGGEKFMFNLYQVPFNGGKGGEATAVPGASHNGMSNYFPRFSPDGKWVVFCRARSFMLLQPDSKLHIMPADYSEPPRELINTTAMNSWHSWSPNNRWLVFSSKLHGPYTDLYLKHIDENGNDTPPVLLSQFRSSSRARNIPEFVNIAQGGIEQITEAFVDYYSYYRKGDKQLFAGDAEGAEAAYLKSIDMNPEFSLARRNYGHLLTMMGRDDEALVQFEKALEIDPFDGRARYLMGAYYYSMNMLPEAERYFTRAMKDTPEFAGSYSGLGKILLQRDEVDEAERMFRAATERDLEYLEAWFYLGSIYMAREDYDRAIECYETVTRFDNDPETFARLGQIYMMLEQNDKAKEVFEAAYKFAPNHAGILHSLGALYAEEGRMEDAEKMLADAYRADPTDVDALYNLSLLYINSGRREDGERALQNVIESNPNDPGAYLILARLLSQAPADHQECVQLYQQAASLAGDPAVYIELGNFFLQSNDRANAVSAFQQALALDPSNTELRAHIEQLQVQQ